MGVSIRFFPPAVCLLRPGSVAACFSLCRRFRGWFLSFGAGGAPPPAAGLGAVGPALRLSLCGRAGAFPCFSLGPRPLSLWRAPKKRESNTIEKKRKLPLLGFASLRSGGRRRLVCWRGFPRGGRPPLAAVGPRPRGPQGRLVAAPRPPLRGPGSGPRIGIRSAHGLSLRVESPSFSPPIVCVGVGTPAVFRLAAHGHQGRRV